MTPTLYERIFRKKPIDAMISDASPGEHGLARSITLFQLTMFGVGATIGTGIFFVLAETVPKAGPGVILSFVLAGIVAGLTALCYAEMASMIPVSGASYSYAYVSLGEGIAFFVAACLILEYGIAGAAVAVGWSGYLNKLVEIIFGVGLPPQLLSAPLVADGYSLSIGGEGYINLPAVLLIGMCTLLLLRGSKESASANAVMVVIKIAVLLMFVIIAGWHFDASLLNPFLPQGFAGVSAAAGTIFFTYIGLDAVSTAGEEVVNPKRNLPLAILLALLIVTTAYILVAVTALGVQPAADFKGQEAGLATILQNITGSNIPAFILAAGAVISVFSVTLVSLYGQTRILFAISRDGLVNPVFSHVDPRTMVPMQNTIIVALFVSAIAAFIPSDVLWDLTSMGTLVAFIIVSLGVMILRYTQPHRPRGFRVPLFPILPILSIMACLYLIYNLSWTVYMLFGIWILLAALYYLTYSVRHSVLEQKARGM